MKRANPQENDEIEQDSFEEEDVFEPSNAISYVRIGLKGDSEEHLLQIIRSIEGKKGYVVKKGTFTDFEFLFTHRLLIQAVAFTVRKRRRRQGILIALYVLAIFVSKEQVPTTNP